METEEITPGYAPASVDQTSIDLGTLESSGVAGWAEAPLLAAASLAIVSLFAVRFASTITNYRYPGVTGLEGTGISGVHAACLRNPVYPDLSGSTAIHLYNFLFYGLYGSVARRTLGCGIELLLSTRLLSALFGVATAVFVGLQARGVTFLERTFVGLLLLAPLVGWWALGVRPDIGALFFFLVSYAAFRAALGDPEPSRRRPLFAVAATALFLSWAFKQSYVFLLPVMAAFALHRSWRDGIAFAAPFLALTGVAFAALGTGGYVLHTITLPAEHPLMLLVGIDNAARAALKGAPVVLAACWLLSRQWRRPRPGETPWFDAAALAWSVVCFGVTAAKWGASDYYYLPTYGIAASVIAASAAALAAPAKAPFFTALAGSMLLLTLVFLGGLVGQTHAVFDRAAVDRARDVLAAAPRPKLVVDEFLALPWLSGDAEETVVDPELYVMNIQPRTHRLEDGVAEGRFATVAYPPSTLPGSLVGAFDLRRYRLQETIGDLEVWIRRDLP